MKRDFAHQPATSVQTCLHVVDATAELALSKPFEALTVSAICKAAGISRTSFYYHFDDKYEVVQWHFDFVAEHNLFETGRTLTWAQAHYLNTHEVLQKRDLYLAAFASRGYQSLFSYSKRRRVETLRETIADYKHLPLDAELDFQIYALAEAEVASVSRWFKDGMPFDLKTLCDYLEGIVPQRLHDTLAEPVNPRLY
ncbi:MAG: TetR/AcrR family transcriptional regulator [Eggerthellaceae bacterium]|nr:TetR/AcrR family transcriptional regulator [Eggerthellaceae bacterium]